MQQLKATTVFGGSLRQFAHESASTQSTMKLHVFLPAGASENQRVPALVFLAGLTCDDERVFMKAPNAMRAAAARGIALVAVDTSPRGLGLPGEDDSYDFGSGAGFYVDATESPWAEHYRMYSYVATELPTLLSAHLPIRDDRLGITGHSMGGHGALVLGLRNPERFRSVSALAPIAHPSQCPWGIKAFTGYLGGDQEAWKAYDATHLVRAHGPLPREILVDQGQDDQFLHDKQLLVEAFEAACQSVHQKLTLRRHEGYDHSYYFIATFIEDHVNFHADALLQ